jgi:hypothetical protein
LLNYRWSERMPFDESHAKGTEELDHDVTIC